MIKKIIMISLAVVLLVTGCSVNTQTNGENVEASNAIQATTEKVTTPTLEPTQQPINETEQKEISAYIDEITLEKPFDSLFINKWELENKEVPFMINGCEYTKGIGMYIDSELILAEQASLTAVWNLEKKYNRITFDLGCEQTMNYDIAKKYGQYEIIIMADGKIAWESGWHDYGFFIENLEVRLDEDCELMEIKLKQRKGSGGTLKVVLGNLKLYNNAE